MKLSELENLVRAMRTRAEAKGIADPNVELFDADEHPLAKNYTIDTWVANDIEQHVVLVSGTAATKGDFALPLTRTL
jgi:hypothetical protein